MLHVNPVNPTDSTSFAMMFSDHWFIHRKTYQTYRKKAIFTININFI